MIVVGIISLLAAIAIPAFVRARHSAQESRMISALRVCAHAFAQRNLESGQYPPDAPPGQIPAGMTEHLAKVSWTLSTPVGGQWDWAPNVPNLGDGIMVLNSTVSDDRMERIDARIDDGVLTLGSFRKIPNTSDFFYSVE
jgi:type II secretory pathway pseudopilin PulG